MHQYTEVCFSAPPVRRSPMAAALRSVDQHHGVGGGQPGVLTLHPDAQQQPQQCHASGL